MTSQLIDLVNSTNNIVFENLKKLNSKFKKIQKNIISSEEEQYDSLNSKISIYFTTFIQQLKMKFILAIQRYEKQIKQNNKDIIDLIMENMLLKLDNNDLEEKVKKYKITFDNYNYTDITFQKAKNSINSNIIKNLHNMKKQNNNNNNQELFEIFNNNNNFKQKKKVNSCNKLNNNNYNFITGSRLDLNKYYIKNKNNVSCNNIVKTIFDSQEDINYSKNKNSYSLKDFHKNKNGLNKNKIKKHSSNKTLKHSNYINGENCIIDNYKSKNNKNFDDNKIKIIEPSFGNAIKNKEKINYYSINKIKEEMDEILSKKNINENNFNNNIININTSGNIIDNQINNNSKLQIGYNYYYSKNKQNNNITSLNNKKSKNNNNIQYKLSKASKPNLHVNISETINTDKYKDSKYKINYTMTNANTRINNNKINSSKNQIKQKNKLTKYQSNNYNISNNINISGNHIMNTNKKVNIINNLNSSILKNLKKISLFSNISNSKSCYKIISSKKNNNIMNTNDSNKKKKLNGYESYEDNINNNISYNIKIKGGISRNYSNFGTNINNHNTYYLNNNYKTINNFNKVSSMSNLNNELNIEDINKSNNIDHNRIYSKINKKNQNNLNININKINDIGKNNIYNNLSSNYLINNYDNDNKSDIKKIIFRTEESDKNQTPSFYIK